MKTWAIILWEHPKGQPRPAIRVVGYIEAREDCFEPLAHFPSSWWERFEAVEVDRVGAKPDLQTVLSA